VLPDYSFSSPMGKQGRLAKKCAEYEKKMQQIEAERDAWWRKEAEKQLNAAFPGRVYLDNAAHFKLENGIGGYYTGFFLETIIEGITETFHLLRDDPTIKFTFRLVSVTRHGEFMFDVTFGRVKESSTTTTVCST
jgi:hypothetical protein